ncbi:MAG: VOC family protein [Solirubrobacterales bacterium]
MIEHVSFNVTPAHAEACAGFYELLGFVRIEPPAGLGARSIWLKSGSTSIHLMFRDRDGVDVARSGPAGAGHVALVVPNHAAVLAALGAAGVEIDPRTEYWDAPRSYVRDPAGNLVELMAAAPQ